MSKSKSKKSGKVDKLGKSAYFEQLEPLQLQLNDMARWLQSSGKRLVVVFEGRDTAGKGGVISAIAQTLNPRQCRVVALAKPSDRESTQWYFQRYVPHLPGAGEIVLFDRSWYNRAGVERVMGYCSEAQAKAFLKQTPVFEQLLVDDDILLFKYWLTVDQDSRKNDSPNAWPIRSSAGSSARWTCRHVPAMPTTAAPATACCAPRTRHTHPGPWSTSTTSGAAASR